jgi:hypothetical protein
MPAVGSPPNPHQGVTCIKCGGRLSAPQYTECFPEEQLMLNLWSCACCGHQFETEAFAPVDATSKIDSEALKEFFPSLLVA